MSSVGGRTENGELVFHYEQLRNDAVSLSAGRTPAPGLALFLRKGMSAWMRAWKPYLATTDAATAPPPAGSLHGSFDIRAQIANILAGMILSRQLEATT